MVGARPPSRNGQAGARVSAVIALAAAGLASSTPALAQTCASEIARLSQQYSLLPEAPRAGSSTAPTARAPRSDAASGTTTTERLARSGGVLAPPDVGSPMAVQPPVANPDRMPTTPDVAPSPPGNSTGTDGSGLTAADRARMESLLQAAQAAERQGKPEQCLERLREAEAIPGKPKTEAR
jgi:hypothetical protein